MQFKFIGNPHARDDRGSVVMYGITFPLNIPVEVQDPFAIRKLMGNHHFSMIDGGVEHYQAKPAATLIIPAEVDRRKHAVAEPVAKVAAEAESVAQTADVKPPKINKVTK